MAQRDPFGNEIKDDAPVSRPDADAFPGMRSAPGPGPRVWTGIVVLVLGLGILGAIAALALFSSSDSDKDTAGRFTVPTFSVPSVSIPALVVPKTEPANEPEQVPDSPPAGLQPGSMLRADRLRRALPRLRAQGSRVQVLRIDAERINANLVGKDGRLKVFSISYDGTSNIVKTQADLSAVPTTSLSAVSSLAPSRAVARAAAALGRAATKVDYVVLTNFAGTAYWYVYFKDHKYLRASLDGRHVERIG